MHSVGSDTEQRLCTAACARLLVILTNDYNEADENRLAMNAGEFGVRRMFGATLARPFGLFPWAWASSASFASWHVHM